MNRIRLLLTIAAAAWFVLPALAAPVPVAPPMQQGPISAALRLRGVLPTTAPLTASSAVIIADKVLLQKIRYEMVTEMRIVKEPVQTPQGKVEVTRHVAVTIPRAVTVEMGLTVKSCKFFVVNKEGKLEALDPAKATESLKKKTAILTGDSSNVDPRTLELVKPGTICVIQLPPDPTAPPPIFPDEKIEKRREP